MDDVDPRLAPAVAALAASGAKFVFVHGSRATGTARPDSDLDVAAWWGVDPPASFEVELPPGVDLMVLDRAPLELRGRVAAAGLLVLDADPVARVRWQSMTRKIYFDERPRLLRAHREFAAAVLERG